MAEQLSLTSIIESAAKLPLVHIHREEFLTKNLRKMCTQTQLHKAIVDGTLHAGIPIETLDSLANAIINSEIIKVTAISTVAGIPGGLAMAATIPADLAQFYGFVIRTAQELVYIYGWDEIFSGSSVLDEATESQLILFIGVMSGVEDASKVVTKLFGEKAMRAAAKKVTDKVLTKACYYPIIKIIEAMVRQKMDKSTYAKGVSKAVPIIGGAVSGGITLATFKPMAHRLQKHLSTMAHMSPEEFAEYEAAIAIDAEGPVTDGEIVEAVIGKAATNFWVCTCGAENKSKFCSECGKAKPAGIPQYRCDKCSWEPDDKTKPPKFCPECGDPFDDGDIVLV